VAEKISPALRRYGKFLKQEYMSKARTSLGLSDLPNGAACYAAFLRANTTSTRTPQEVFELGSEAVAKNLLTIGKLGKATYKTADLANIVQQIKKKPDEHFASEEDLLSFSKGFLNRAKIIAAQKLVSRMPKQDIQILPLPAFEEAAGVGSRYLAEPDVTKAAVYLIKLGNYATLTRAEAEINAAHETVPGHFLQKALATSHGELSKLAKFVDNPAYSEGWARYAEGLAEDANFYATVDSAILRRTWAARGMVVDPGIHVFHWTRQQAIDYIVQSGRFTPQEANDYVDRIAVTPAQLTSYDSGALEILALREEARHRLGARFDLRSFDDALTDEGAVPMGELRRHVEEWIRQASASITQ
jgi:uncharacterized protein (DUF885 family)